MAAKKRIRRAGHSSPDLVHQSVHRLRYYRHRVVKVPIAQIASEEGVKESTVRNSIDLIEQYNAAVNPEVMMQVESAIIMALAPLHQAALEGGLMAEKVMRDSSGSPIEGKSEPDYDIRLRASELVQDLIKSVVPKTGSVNVGVSVNAGNGNGNGGGGPLALTTYEDKMREIQRRRVEQNAIPMRAESLEENSFEMQPSEPELITVNAQPPRSTS